jgi:hypothetical protein
MKLFFEKMWMITLMEFQKKNCEKCIVKAGFLAFCVAEKYGNCDRGICFDLQEEEEQWISGEELYTEGSSDDDDTAVRSRRAGGKARKHRRTAAMKDTKHKEGHNKSDITPSTVSTNAEFGVIPPEMRLESLTLTTEESHRCQPQEGNMLVTDIDEQIKISWRPKRGSIKLPNLSPDGRVEVVTGTDVVTH